MCVPSKLKASVIPFASAGLLQPDAASPVLENKLAATRMRLWELNEKYHCPVVGSCVAMPDLVKIAKRCGLNVATDDEFSLHVEIVGRVRVRNKVSESLQRYLDNKYQLHIERFSRLKTDADILAQWKASLKKGDVAGALWAALTHKAVSVDTRHVIYADTHMLSHQIGAGQVADARRLQCLEAENAELKQALQKEREAAQQQLAALRQRNAELTLRQAELETGQVQFNTLRQRLNDYESGQEIVALQREILALKKSNQQLQMIQSRSWMLEKRLLASQAEAQVFSQERDLAEAERETLEQLLSSFLDEPVAAGCSGQQDEACGACAHALSARCILYVGGRLSMLAQYRQLADRLGVRLIHHDGGLEESLTRLPEMLHGADVVVCPTDHISHAAYNQIKSHCKRIGKPCLFYRGAGVGSFATAINRIARGDFSLPAHQPAEER